MLIDDLDYLKRSANYMSKTSGMDHWDSWTTTSKNWHAYPVQNFDYQFNSWGFRGPEYKQFIGKPVNICLGDSFTVNVGGPIEHSWCSQLAKHFDIPTLNLGMDGAGNDAIRLVYNRACEIFDVQNTFVMYSFLHRRLCDKKFIRRISRKIENEDDNENFQYFLTQRISSVYEAMIPFWCWTDSQMLLLSGLNIYMLSNSAKNYYADYRQIVDQSREVYVCKDNYNKLSGDDWPTLKQFIHGADPHPDLLTEKFAGVFYQQLIEQILYCNRDGHHMNYETNKLYADYFYNKWKQNNES